MTVAEPGAVALRPGDASVDEAGFQTWQAVGAGPVGGGTGPGSRRFGGRRSESRRRPGGNLAGARWLAPAARRVTPATARGGRRALRALLASVVVAGTCGPALPWDCSTPALAGARGGCWGCDDRRGWLDTAAAAATRGGHGRRTLLARRAAGGAGGAVSWTAGELQVATEVRGEENTTSFRRFFLDAAGRVISPWHELPLKGADGEFWMVTEIPKMTKSKMEIATKEPFNPIAQDTDKGKLREYHGPIFWNYGYLPQTWEDPSEEHPHLEVFGDNDPVDVVEIGARARAQGEVARVRVLGALAMVDDGELDWKVLAIAADDPLAPSLRDVADIEARLPGVVSGVREWFRWYKTPDGKPLSEFGFQEKTISRSQTLEVIEETHGFWRRLRASGGASASAGGLWTGAAAAQAA